MLWPMGYLRAYLVTIAAGLSCAVACGGSEFDSGGGAGGADAAAGQGGSAGQDAGAGGSAGSAGSSGSAGADAGSATCRSDYVDAKCKDNRLTTGNSVCDMCAQDNCCPQIDACLANPDCARVMFCYLNNCVGKPATNCVTSTCGDCSTGFIAFASVSGCIQNNCIEPKSTACPEFIP